MEKKAIRVLFVSNHEGHCAFLEEQLSKVRNTLYFIDLTSEISNIPLAPNYSSHNVFIIDSHMGQDQCLDFLREINEKEIKIPVIIFSDQECDAKYQLFIDAGATDFITKTEITPALLDRSILYAIKNNEVYKRVIENEYQFRSLFEKSVDALFITSKNYTIQEANDSFLTLLECEREKIKELELPAIFYKTEDYLFFVDSILKESPLKGWEVVLLTTKGKKIECQMAAVPIYNYDGKIVGYQCIIHDLTKRKKAERDLLHAELLSVTGKMARSMAHEVRNPLTNLTLALGQLKDEFDEEDEDVLMLSDIIARNAKRIEAIITEMLNNSVLDKLILDTMPLSELIHQGLETVEDRIVLKGIKLKTELSTDIPAFPVDGNKMNIAITNLLVNAIEAMEDNTGQLTIKTYSDDDNAIIEIGDNGKGIDEESINKLFNPFFTKKHGGMGLGLTNTKNIITAHGGEINIESELAQGTTFIIKLPFSTK